MKVFARYFHILSIIISSSTFSYPQPRSACSSAAAAYEKKIKFFLYLFPSLENRVNHQRTRNIASHSNRQTVDVLGNAKRTTTTTTVVVVVVDI